MTRDEFKKYYDTIVRKNINMHEKHLEELGHCEIAILISVPDIQKKYRDLAVKLLTANIDYYRPEATTKPIPEKKRRMGCCVNVIDSCTCRISQGYLNSVTRFCMLVLFRF